MPSKQQTLNDLNPQQKKAVMHDKGPLLIVAGAGTGKTTVITRRIANLIFEKKCLPGQILALTFTDKAANEMEYRVDLLVPYGYVDVSISTFHAFGDRIIRDYALDLGISPDYKVMTRPEQIVFFREHIFDFPLKHYKSLGDPTKHIQAILQVISRAKDEDISPVDYLKYAENYLSRAGKSGRGKRGQNRQEEESMEEAKKHLEIARVYEKYEELKFQKGKLDFGDQVNLALLLFRKHPSILKKVQQKYKYIMVDEFQDTNYSQFELLKLLAGKDKNIVVVGDDDQSIFKFRGAAISNILNFEKQYPKTKKIVLTSNYRSSQPLLDDAYRLIKHNDPDRLEVKAKINKKLKAVIQEKGRRPIYQHFDKSWNEADFVARTIKEKHKKNKIPLKEFAILVRTNAMAEPFIQSLNMFGLPHNFSGAGGLYTYKEVRLALCFLKVIGDLSDSVSLHELATSDIYKLSPLDLRKCSTFAGRRHYTLYHVFEHLDDAAKDFEVLSDIPTESREIIRSIVTDISVYLEYARDHTSGEVLYKFLKDTGYLKRLSFTATLESERKIKNLACFFEKVRAFQAVTEFDRVAEFIKYMSILRQAGDAPESVKADPDQDAVNILTLHKAKGLEFEVVFMVGLAKDKFPTRERKDLIELPEKLIKEILPVGDFHLQEERRLFYVGMTRAKKELYLSSALDYGTKRQWKTGQFVIEALDMPKVDIALVKKSAAAQIDLFASPLSKKELPESEKQGLLPLSFYQLSDYGICPLKYKYAHVLKIPLLPNHSIIYGAVLHDAVQAYNLAKKHKQKFSIKEFIKVFESSWRSEGFISLQHEKERFAAGQKALQHFYKTEAKNKVVPFFVEEPFTLLKDNIQLKGRFDRVDIVDGHVHIIDFKSSEVKTQKDADQRTKNSLQLWLYAFAYKEMFKKTASQICLYFLDSGLIGRADVTDDKTKRAWEKVLLLANGIRQNNYKASPGSFACSYCPYSDICPDTVV